MANDADRAGTPAGVFGAELRFYRTRAGLPQQDLAARANGWFQQWAGIEAQATVLRWYEPLVVPGLLQTEEYARAILSARPDGNLDDLDEQVAARLARQAAVSPRRTRWPAMGGAGWIRSRRGLSRPGGLFEVVRPVESAQAPIAGFGDDAEHQVPWGDLAAVARGCGLGKAEDHFGA